MIGCSTTFNKSSMLTTGLVFSTQFPKSSLLSVASSGAEQPACKSMFGSHITPEIHVYSPNKNLTSSVIKAYV